MILGFSGKIGSGKSTLCSEIANELGWKYTSFGLYVRKVAISQSIDPTRENLQNLGERLLNENVKKFCVAALKESNWIPGQPLVIEGFRHEKVVYTIRDIVKPDIFKLIFLKISDENVRKSRIEIRDNTSLTKADRHPTENEVINGTLLKLADLVVDAEKDVLVLKSEIIDWAVNR